MNEGSLNLETTTPEAQKRAPGEADCSIPTTTKRWNCQTPMINYTTNASNYIGRKLFVIQEK